MNYFLITTPLIIISVFILHTVYLKVKKKLMGTFWAIVSGFIIGSLISIITIYVFGVT